MPKIVAPRSVLERRYEKAALEYLDSLPLEHFMESTDQSTQRKITVASLDVLAMRRRDVHVFSELLVQYPRPKRKDGNVVPDNMVVIHDGPIKAKWSFALALQPARPFWVLEYVSKRSQQRDYTSKKRKYERELNVPYYLLFHPGKQELIFYRHDGNRYVAIAPNTEGKLVLPELDLEMTLLDGWVRFLHQGELLPVTTELQMEKDEIRRECDKTRRALDEMTQRALAAERELAELRTQKKTPRSKPNGTH